MKNLICSILTVTVLSLWGSVNAVATEAVYKFEKGHVIDFLYLKRRAGSGPALQDYFKVAIPAARELGYKPVRALEVAGKPTKGNMYPDIVALGAWPGDFEDRENVLQSLLKAIPDLHSRRMDIWSTFNMSLYEVDEDIEFTLNSEKYYVLSAYWQRDGEAFEKFSKDTKAQARRSGAAIVFELKDSQSPFGYMHEPDWVVLTEWENETSFKAHQNETKGLNQRALRHVTEFPVRAPKPRG